MLIELKGINKTYDNGQPLHVLKGIDLGIERGEFVSIMGASGSGKSTLLNILGILDNYDTGEYWLDGKLIKDLSEKTAADYRNRMIGFVFQSFNLINFKTAVENVELPLYYQGVPRKKRREMAMEYLEKLGLTDWASHFPNEMSGGQKQRVAIARALITRPQIILADEPNTWRNSGSRPGPRTFPTRCPAARNSASPSPAPSSPARRSSWPTSPRARWIPRPAWK